MGWTKYMYFTKWKSVQHSVLSTSCRSACKMYLLHRHLGETTIWWYTVNYKKRHEIKIKCIYRNAKYLYIWEWNGKEASSQTSKLSTCIYITICWKSLGGMVNWMNGKGGRGTQGRIPDVEKRGSVCQKIYYWPGGFYIYTVILFVLL